MIEKCNSCLLPTGLHQPSLRPEKTEKTLVSVPHGKFKKGNSRSILEDISLDAFQMGVFSQSKITVAPDTTYPYKTYNGVKIVIDNSLDSGVALVEGLLDAGRPDPTPEEIAEIYKGL